MYDSSQYLISKGFHDRVLIRLFCTQYFVKLQDLLWSWSGVVNNVVIYMD